MDASSNKPVGGVTPNESPDLILDDSDGEESTSSDKSDGDLDDVVDIEEKLLPTDQIDDFLKKTVLKDLENISGHRELNQKNAEQQIDKMFRFETKPTNLNEFNQEMLKQLAEIAYPEQKDMTNITKEREDFKTRNIVRFDHVILYISWQAHLMALLELTMKTNTRHQLPILK